MCLEPEQSPPADVKTIKNQDPGHRDIVPDPDVITEEEWVRGQGHRGCSHTLNPLRICLGEERRSRLLTSQ